MTGNTETYHRIDISFFFFLGGGGGVIGRMNNMDEWKAKIQALI